MSAYQTITLQCDRNQPGRDERCPATFTAGSSRSHATSRVQEVRTRAVEDGWENRDGEDLCPFHCLPELPEGS